MLIIDTEFASPTSVWCSSMSDGLDEYRILKVVKSSAEGFVMNTWPSDIENGTENLVVIYQMMHGIRITRPRQQY